MRLDFNLQLQQEQKLIMTQEMQLAVKMLQLTSLELKEYIEEQLIENPLIEVEEKKYDKDDKNILEEYVKSNDYESYEDGYFEEKEYVSPLNFIAKKITLWEYLKEQLGFIPLNNKSKKIGEYIIDNIDEMGYLSIALGIICEKLGVKINEVKEMLDIIQNFEPSGVGARDLKECLIIQLKNKGLYDSTYENIVNNMLEEVGKGDIVRIAEQNRIKNSRALEIVNEIKKLDPKPGIRMSLESASYVIPDVYIEKVDGEFIVTVKDDFIPRIRVNKIYRKILVNKEAAEYKYVKEKLQSAMWLIKSIEQRMDTIKKVVTAILDYQISYFEGDGDLKTLTLKQIADELDMHESTISRAVRGKYAQTPRGLFEIKNFFIKGIQNRNGDEIPTFKIKDKIKELIDKEDKKKPYSDKHISEILIKEGIDISRRTVAKYREEMKIESSSKRKIRVNQ